MAGCPPVSGHALAASSAGLVEAGAIYELIHHGGVWLGFIAEMFVASWVLLLVHELGHLVAGRLVGFRFFEVKLGAGRRMGARRSRFVVTEWSFWPVLGLVRSFMPRREIHRLRAAIFYLGGPLASLLMVAAAFWWRRTVEPVGPDQWFSSASQLALFLALGFFAISLWPATQIVHLGVVISDGALLCDLFRPSRGETALHIAYAKILHAHALRAHGLEDRAIALCDEVFADPAFEDSWPMRRSLVVLASTIGFAEQTSSVIRKALLSPIDEPKEFAIFADSFASGVLFRYQPPCFEEALLLVRRASELCPELLTLKGTMGGLLFEMGERGDARPLLQACYDGNGSPADRGISAAYLAHYALAEKNTDAVTNYVRDANGHPRCQPLVERILANLRG
jgi:hypothetical protein